MPETCAEQIILQRGIATPEDINLEAIASTLGAKVKRRFSCRVRSTDYWDW